VVTVEKEGQSLKVLLEASPRYSKMNFYNLDGRMEKREQFEARLAPELNRVAEIFPKKDQIKGAEKSEEMGIGR